MAPWIKHTLAGPCSALPSPPASTMQRLEGRADWQSREGQASGALKYSVLSASTASS